jgi:hypothetical protein
MRLKGADEILLLGSEPAAAATVIGSEAIDNVDLLNEPGNAYVAEWTDPAWRAGLSARSTGLGSTHASGIWQIIDLATA